MERGLLWLPLLALFIWLAWAGWNEYQKVEAYREWAKGFERVKYDIYAVLGQQGTVITWGVPTRHGPINLRTVSLMAVQAVQLRVDQRVWTAEQLQVIQADAVPSGRAIALELICHNGEPTAQIPFTEVGLAIDWALALAGELNSLASHS